MELRMNQLLAEFIDRPEIAERNPHYKTLFAATPTTATPITTADLAALEKRMEERMDRVLAEFKERTITERNHYSNALFAVGAPLRKAMANGAIIVAIVLDFFKSLWLESAPYVKEIAFWIAVVIFSLFSLLAFISLFFWGMLFFEHRVVPWIHAVAGA